MGSKVRPHNSARYPEDGRGPFVYRGGSCGELLTPLLAIATPLLVAFFVYYAQRNLSEVKELRKTTDRVEHTLDVDRALDAVLLEVTQSESGQRGYLLTGRRRISPRTPRRGSVCGPHSRN